MEANEPGFILLIVKILIAKISYPFIQAVCAAWMNAYELWKQRNASKRRCFSKTYPSFLTLKEGSTFLTKPLFPQGREDVTALRCSEPLRFMVGGPSKVCAMFCGLGPPGDNLLMGLHGGREFTIYNLQLIVYRLLFTDDFG